MQTILIILNILTYPKYCRKQNLQGKSFSCLCFLFAFLFQELNRALI